MAVARIMKAYEEQKYAVWKDQVNATLMSYLKKNLLSKPNLSSASGTRHPTSNDIPVGVETVVLTSISMQKSQG